MEEKRKSLYPQILLSLVQLGQISIDTFKNYIRLFDVKTIAMMYERIATSYSFDGLINQVGVTTKEEKSIEFILSLELNKKLGQKSALELIDLLSQIVDIKTRETIISSLYQKLFLPLFTELIQIVENTKDADVFDAALLVIDKRFKSTSFGSVILLLDGKMPEPLENVFFLRLKNELDDCIPIEFALIVNNSNYDLFTSAFRKGASRIEEFSIDEAIMFFSNLWKFQKEEDYEEKRFTLMRYLLRRFEELSTEEVLEKTWIINDSGMNEQIILNVLDRRSNEISALLFDGQSATS